MQTEYHMYFIYITAGTISIKIVMEQQQNDKAKP